VIDAIARRGTLFANHFVQSPVCVASRVCELTSRYAHQTGILENSVHYNWGRWPEGLIAFPELFAAAGYATVNLGKYHTPHHHTWLENWHFELADGVWFNGIDARFDEGEHAILHLGNQPAGVLMSGQHPRGEGRRTATEIVTDRAIEWLGSYGHVRRPFLLRVSYLAPHSPVVAPEPFYSAHDPADQDFDAPTEAMLAACPDFERVGMASFRRHDLDQIRRMRATYHGLVSHVDEQIGRIIARLEEQGELGRTIVVVTSDHGNLIGEYGQFHKGVFYDITTRVPCVIAGLGVPAGKRVLGLSESIDLGPTLLRLAGIAAPAVMEGRDLFGGHPPREDVIGEILQPTSGRPRRRSWIRTERWSMNYTSEIGHVKVATADERDGKLVDLVRDPLEHANLYRDPAHASIVAELTQRFEERTARDRRPVQLGEPPARWR
jgi:choline-sulfatase